MSKAKYLSHLFQVDSVDSEVMVVTWSSASVSAAVGEVTNTVRVEMSSALERLQRQSQSIRIAVFFALFALTASLDLIVDHDLVLFALYLIPTLYAAWYLGSRWAYGGCLASGMVWYVRDWPGRHSYHALIPYGNLAGRLLVLFIIVAIVNALKGALEDQYQAEQRAVQTELQIASEVQRRLLPSRPPDAPGLDLGFLYRPARQLGGDYYDFIPLSSKRIAIAVGDISGKGLPGALLMATLQSLVRTNLAVREEKLGRFAVEISESLYEQTTYDRYATLFLATVDTASSSLQYVNAGHNPPLFFPARTTSAPDSTLNQLDKGGLPLGMFAGNQYRCGDRVLGEGDVLVVYTDGVTEAANAGQEQFGEERLRETVRASLSLSAAEICQTVADRVQAFTAGTPQWDDITLAVVKVTPDLIAPGKVRVKP